MRPSTGSARLAALAVALAALWLGAGEPLFAAAAPPRARYRILDAEGAPVPFARITLFGSPGSVVADAGGVFSLPAAPREPFRINVFSAEGAWLGILALDPGGREGGIEDLRLRRVERVEVTVQTGVAPTTLSPPAAGATVISREETSQRTAARVVEVMQEVPGTTNVGSGHAAVPSVRGLARGRTLILLDDARVTSERRAGPSATYLNPFTLESLEVVRGPGSVIYGSDALGGIIHGRTPVPRRGRRSVRLEAGAGTGVPMGSLAAEAAFPAGGGALLLAAHQRSFGEYDAPEGEMPNSGARDRGFLGKWLLPGSRGRWVLGLQVDQGREIGKPRMDASGAATRYPEEDSARFTANAILPPPGPMDSLELHLFAGRYALVTERRAAGGGSLERSDVEASDASARIVAGLPLGRGSLRLGLDASSRFGLSARTLSVSADPNVPAAEQDSVESADRLDAGLFVEGTRPLAGDRLILAGGLRGQGVWTRNDGGILGDRGRSSATMTGYAAGTVSLGGGWSTTLQAARGFREPTLSDRYFSGLTGRGFIQGSPDLEPESSRQFDLSLRRQGRRTLLAVYAYHYTIEELIERFRVSATDFAFRNRGEAEIQGAELEAEWEPGLGVTLRLTYTQARGTELDEGGALADIPPRRARLGLGRAGRGRTWWRLGYDLTWRDPRPGPGEADMPARGLMDLAAGVRLGAGLEVRLVGANLLDRSYPASADDDSALAPGRQAALYLTGTY